MGGVGYHVKKGNFDGSGWPETLCPNRLYFYKQLASFKN